MNVLERICADKRTHLATKEAQTPLPDLLERIKDQALPRGFISALRSSSPAIIAEVKKASPSKGVIREDFDAPGIAKIYEENGAACLSILTDEPYFQGHDEYLVAVKKAVSLPLLRKDFMLEPYQIYESQALGADCILLIMAALDDEKAQELYDLSVELGMDVLIEVHDMEELDRALALTISPDHAMIGVNNRNLKTLDVDIETGLAMSASIPDKFLKVAESGIGSYTDIQTFQGAAFGAFLVGESLMRQPDIGAALKKLRGTS